MKDKIVNVLTILMILVLLGGTCIVLLYLRCQQLNSPPEVLIYPGSTLVEEVSGGTAVFPVYDYHYISIASPDEIVNFYTYNKVDCHQTSGLKVSQVCTGDTKPSGIYSVHIDFEFDKVEPLTTYFISVHWTRCGNFD